MSERLRERFGYFTEDIDSQIRSASPADSRSPRRASRSPRPNNGEPREIAVAIPLVRDSRPDIAAWPAPPQNVPLTCISGNVRTPTAAPVRPSVSPVAVSPVSNGGSTKTEIDDPTTLLTMLKVAAASSANGAPRGRETELKRKIQTLEETVAEYERQKYNVMGTFSEYRERVAERERKLEAEYSSKIIALSEEVLGAKKDFEARMKSFQALQDKFEREKEQALEKLRQEHQKEIQLLEQRFSESQLLNLEQKYMIEIQRLEEERKSLRAEKDRLGETFEMKLRRAQSLYETELTAAKMLYTKELEALRDHEDALKEELLARQDEFHDRLQELQHQMRRSREELASCRNEVTALERKLQSKEIEVQALSKELEDARTETNDAMKRLSQSTSEYNEHRQKFQQQEEELKKKSKLLNTVEAAKAKDEIAIRDLQTEVRALKNKVEFLEKERANLQSQSESQAKLHNSQVNALEAVLESVTKEKESTTEQYEGLLLKERQQAEAREHAMKKEFSSKLNELEEQYTSLKEDLEHSARLDRDELRESTQHEIHALKTERALLKAEVSALKQKFLENNDSTDEKTDQLSTIVRETTELTKTLEEYRERISSKDEEIAALRRRVEQEQQLSEEQIRNVREELRSEILNSPEYQNSLMEIERLHSQIASNERRREKAEEAEQGQTQRVEKLQDENEKLKARIRELEEADKLKEKEKSDSEEKENDIALLKQTIAKLQEENNELHAKCERNKSADEALRKEMNLLQTDNGAKTQQIEALHTRVQELLDQISGIKEELVKKNIEFQQIGDRTEIKLEMPNSEAGEKLKQLKLEYEKTIESLKQREVELKDQLEHFRNDMNISQQSLEESSNLIQNLQAEIRNKDSMILQIQEELKIKGQHLLGQEETIKAKEVENRTLAEEIERSKDRYEEMCRQLKLERKKADEQRDQSVSIEIQTDPVVSTHVPVVDLAREKELKSRITELEHALEIKSDLIEKLHEQLPDVSREDVALKKKDRSQSMTAGGVFQNFVSQMKDKRDEANERNRKKEAEKKAAKEAAREVIKEKSPLRSKSPSLLTRLRDRSPVKTRSTLDNLEMTPSTSSRNLLSPIDAERLERRGSPSRPLFSAAAYDVRLNSRRRGHCRAHRSPIVCSKKSNASKPLTIVIRLLDIGVHGWKEALRNDDIAALSLFSRDRLPLRIPAIVAYSCLGSLHSTICLTSTLSTHSFS
ncbi:hypothetical protein Q1695_000955 [Nippostrongylus brasiliensis]|nr:hypothetical protein Q1695_000955 [Nippostrongylus brasiliensis]